MFLSRFFKRKPRVELAAHDVPSFADSLKHMQKQRAAAIRYLGDKWVCKRPVTRLNQESA